MSNRNPKKIYVSNISRDVRERDLGRLFEEVGRIDRLQFKNRFAFVEFERSRECEDAVHKFDGMFFMGRRLRVEPYCYRGGDRKYRSDHYSNDYRVFITNLDSMTSWQDLKDFGRTAGKSVTFADVRVLRDSDDHSRKNQLEGIIEYSDINDFENALKELDGARLNGVRVKVYSKSSYDRSKFSEDDRNDSRRGGRSRSRSRERPSRRKYSRSPSPKANGNGGGHYGRDRNARSVSRERSRSRSRNNRRRPRRSPSASHSRSRSMSRHSTDHIKKESSTQSHDVNNGNVKKSPSRSPSHDK